ncbi:MAG: hypothetical protein Q8L48_32215 [Archangium sp.]|nr:hypothetical protein [Archangium sp.]
MTEPSAYEVSATYARGFAKAAKDLGLLPALKPRCSPQALEFLMDPDANRWWPSAAVEACTELIHEMSGEATLFEVGYRTVAVTVGPVLLPLVKVSLTLFGATPATLLKRVADLSSSSLRGMISTWKPGGPRDGEVTLTYPTQVPRGYGELWRGALRWVCEAADAKDPRAELLSHTGKVLTFKVTWR